MVKEVLEEHKLPAEFGEEVVLSLEQADKRGAVWWMATAPERKAAEEEYEREKELLASMQEAIGEVPEWAAELSKAMPGWGFDDMPSTSMQIPLRPGRGTGLGAAGRGAIGATDRILLDSRARIQLRVGGS